MARDLVVPRVVPENGSLPYYFTWVAHCLDGRSIPQYDAQGRAWALGATPEEVFALVKAVDVFVHSAYMTGSPTLRLPVRGRFTVEYQARQSLSVSGKEVSRYFKQQILVTCVATGLAVVGTPEDFETAGQVPGASWSWEIQQEG